MAPAPDAALHFLVADRAPCTRLGEAALNQPSES
jgi:hypothetical protein